MLNREKEKFLGFVKDLVIRFTLRKTRKLSSSFVVKRTFEP